MSRDTVTSTPTSPAYSVCPPQANPEPTLPLPFALEARSGAYPRLCVVIPVYNEAKVLLGTHAELSRALENLGVDWSMLFVNDGSRDASAAVLESLASLDSRVSYILLSRDFV